MEDFQLLVTVTEPGVESAQVEELSLALRDELLALDVQDVRAVSGGAAPPGTRGIDVAAVGALLVTLQSATSLVEKLVRTISGWLAPGPPGRSVEVSIGDKVLKLSGASAEDQRRLIDEFVQAVRESEPSA